MFIGEISEEVPVVTPDTKGREVDRIFKDFPHLQGVVVVENNRPIGLVMKTQFYQQIGIKFGFDVFMGRPIKLLTNKYTLVVDYSQKITDVSSLAMKRKQEHMYDYIIITRNDLFHGIVTIKTLLTILAEIQVNHAKYTNPLTGLPGNNIITDRLSTIIHNTAFSVLYIDLDNFKSYNDTYGFNKGDQLLRETANILTTHVMRDPESFVGHIGGDDFIAIVSHQQYKVLCQAIIYDFDKKMQHFYTDQDLIRGYIYAKNRKGLKENIPIVSISIAVVTNQVQSFTDINDLSKVSAELKKKCKENSRSCFCSNLLPQSTILVN